MTLIATGLAAGLILGWFVRMLTDGQRDLLERRRRLTSVQLELAGHAERFEVCRRAQFGVAMPQDDWAWIRYELVGKVDAQLLAVLAAYYAGLETAWNPRFVSGGPFGPGDEELCRQFLTRNRRLYQRLEQEITAITEVHTLGLTYLRNGWHRRPALRRRAEVVTADRVSPGTDESAKQATRYTQV